jgi:flagellar biosynthesis GTPase FlhF
MESTRADLTQENLEYLKTLDEQGYTDLCNYLIKMHTYKNRNEQIDSNNNLTFSESVNIIISTIEAITKTVVKKIAKSSNVVFLLGMTGSGKTTTFHYLCGHPMRLVGQIMKVLKQIT